MEKFDTMDDELNKPGRQGDKLDSLDPELRYVHDLLEKKVADAQFDASSRVDWEDHKIIIAIGAIRRIMRMYESYLFHSKYFIARVPSDEEIFLRLRHGFVSNLPQSDMPKQLVQDILNKLPESLPPVSDLVLYDEEIRARTLDDFRSIESKLLQHALDTDTLIDIALADTFFLTHDDQIEALSDAYLKHVDPHEHNFRKRYLTSSSDQLNQQIENIELELRHAICSQLHNNLCKVPVHITSKLKERLYKSSAESRSTKSEKLSNLPSLLEYADLRELQDIILNKSIWAQFEDVFDDKSTTDRKFDQLASLRNTIRHSRTLDKITQLEGEAAITWFRTMLKDGKEPS